MRLRNILTYLLTYFPKFNQFFLVQTQISDKILVKIQSAVFTRSC